MQRPCSASTELAPPPGMEPRIGWEPDRIPRHWSKPLRTAVAATGLALLLETRKAKGLARASLGVFGVGLLTRALTNRDLASTLGMILSPMIRLRRSIEVAAPLDEVYDFWRRFENYPHFMSYVAGVSVNESGGLRWIMNAPGMRLKWDASILSLSPSMGLRWRSSADSPIHHEGDVRFTPTASGESTRVDVFLAFAPPAGVLGYAVAHWLGFDPRDRIDTDLQRMKELIERAYRETIRTQLAR